MKSNTRASAEEYELATVGLRIESGALRVSVLVIGCDRQPATRLTGDIKARETSHEFRDQLLRVVCVPKLSAATGERDRLAADGWLRCPICKWPALPPEIMVDRRETRRRTVQQGVNNAILVIPASLEGAREPDALRNEQRWPGILYQPRRA